MRVTLNLDYNIVPLDRDEIAPFLEQCLAAGVQRVLWRLSICGKVAYPSRIREIVEHSTVSERVAAFDPLEVALEAGARLGIEVVPWITLFDEIFEWATLVSEEVKSHPEWQLQNEAGEAFPGMLCYATPGARQLKLAELEEILAYDPPALYLCTRSHAAHNLPRPFPPRDSYSHHPLLTAETPGLRARQHGEQFSGFLADVRQLAGKTPLSVGIRLQPLSAMNLSPWARMARFWRSWEIDELILGAGDDLLDMSADEIARQVQAYEGAPATRSCWVRLWDWRPDTDETDPVPTWPAQRLLEGAEALAAAGIESICLHEVKNVIDRDLWQAVKRISAL